MSKTLRIISLAITLLATTSVLMAQDLSSQRGESQSLGTLLGEKLDHQGLIINPTPQSIQQMQSCFFFDRHIRTPYGSKQGS